MAESPRIEELKRRVHSDPASIAFAALAEEYRRAGRFDEAIETCTTGLVRHPSYLSAHVTLGRAFIEVGRLQDAREELEYVLKLAPENLAAIRGLAEIHHRIGEDHSEHVEQVEPAETAPPVASVIEKDQSPAVPAAPRIALKVRVHDQPEVQASDVATRVDDIPPVHSPVPTAVNRVDERAELSPPSSVPTTIVTLTADSAVRGPFDYQTAVDPALAGLEEFLKAI